MYACAYVCVCARSQLGAAVGGDVLWGNGGRYAVCSSWKTVSVSSPSSLFPLSAENFFFFASFKAHLCFTVSAPKTYISPYLSPPPLPSSLSPCIFLPHRIFFFSLLLVSSQREPLSPHRVGFLLSPHTPHRVSSCYQTFSLKPGPPFISALLSPLFFISPSRFCRGAASSFQLSSPTSLRSPGDSFSVQIFAFHEYAIIKHPA